MDKGNIEEKIECDEKLNPEAKQWLGQTLVSKHSMSVHYVVLCICSGLIN